MKSPFKMLTNENAPFKNEDLNLNRSFDDRFDLTIQGSMEYKLAMQTRYTTE